jgi:GNAT superfamily N-acetyltransferase
MNISIRNYHDNDLEFIQEVDFLLWLEVQYHGDYINENIFTAVDDNNQVLGVGCLSFHLTWHVVDEDIMHKLKLDMAIDYENKHAKQAKSLLMDKLIEKLDEYKEKYSNNKMCICNYCESDKVDDIQFFMSKGFTMSGVTPVLKFDLSKDIKHYDIPDYISIKPYPINEDTVDNYINATALGYGMPDSKAEMLFQAGGESFKLFTAMDKGKVVSAITLWEIGDGRCATENIFTVPEYRRKNIAREIIATGLEYQKNAGHKIATLSMDGTNLRAMKLYLSMGYEFMYTLIEMRYE